MKFRDIVRAKVMQCLAVLALLAGAGTLLLQQLHTGIAAQYRDDRYKLYDMSSEAAPVNVRNPSSLFNDTQRFNAIPGRSHRRCKLCDICLHYFQ
jgi:hypothetical protein